MKSIQSIGARLLDGLLLGLVTFLSGTPGAIATPTEPIGCPEGWALRSQELYPQIRVCLPKHLTLPIPSLDLSQQPARIQVQQLRIVQTDIQANHDDGRYGEPQNFSSTSIRVYQRTAQ
ncbi:MAG: hypothetical protein VKJ86_09775 [Synechococcus sp.]|nr:hypothetical protein [Synechococcus sp.]